MTDLTDAAIEWHLQQNVYPPAPVQLIPAIREAFTAHWEGEPDRLIALNREHATTHGIPIAWEPASVLIENLRLEELLNDDEGDDEW